MTGWLRELLCVALYQFFFEMLKKQIAKTTHTLSSLFIVTVVNGWEWIAARVALYSK